MPEVAKILGVHRQTAWRFVDRGELTAYRYGNEWLVNKSDVVAFKEQRDVGGVKVAENSDKKTRTVTVTYEMEDVKCPDCGVLFSLPEDIIRDKIEEGEELSCPACGASFGLEDESEDEGEEGEEAEEVEEE